MSVVGFDFGTLNSVVAVARKRGIDVLQNEVGHRATTTCVAFHGKQRFLGQEASAQFMGNSKNTISNVKRLLGRPFTDPELKSHEAAFTSVKLVEGNHGQAAIQVNYDDKAETFAPEQVAGAFLSKLKQVAEGGLDGLKVHDCVIGVPSWWTDVQRRALLDASGVAGLNVLRLINENTAVALNYGILRPLPKDTTQKVLFFDMGHSQTTATVVAFTEGKLQVLASASDRSLGGRDLDEFLVTHFTQVIKDKYKLDPTTEVKAMLKLRKECERVKLHLSANSKVQFGVEYLMNDRDVSALIERTEFEKMVSEAVLPRLLIPIQQALDQAKLTKADLHSIEIVGGSTRVPAVQHCLTNFFGRELSKTCDGDESVARGCALMCAMISPSFKVREFEIQDIHSYPVEIHWGPIPAAGQPFTAEDSTPLFTLNNPLPSVKLVSFNDRVEPFQVVAKYSADSGIPFGVDPVIGKFNVSGMPNKEKTKIKVRVKLSQHGTVSVTSAQLIEEIPEEPVAAPAAAAAPAEGAKMEDVPAPATPAADGAAAPADGAGKMEDVPAAEAAKPAEPKKVKVRREDLKVESHLNGGIQSSGELNAFFERETSMANQDRVIAETQQARNDLEAYILDMRNKLSSDLQPYVKDADRDTFNSQLTTMEDWLYNDGFDCQKSEYKKKLAELKVHGDPINSRQYEDQNRESFVSALKSAIGHYQQWTQTTEEKYAHISGEERQKITNECQSVDQFLSAALTAQAKLALHDNPSISCEQLRQKKIALEVFCNPIINKSKPAPPKEEKKAEEKKAEEAKPAAEEAKPAEDAKPAAEEAKPMEA